MFPLVALGSVPEHLVPDRSRFSGRALFPLPPAVNPRAGKAARQLPLPPHGQDLPGPAPRSAGAPAGAGPGPQRCPRSPRCQSGPRGCGPPPPAGARRARLGQRGSPDCPRFVKCRAARADRGVIAPRACLCGKLPSPSRRCRSVYLHVWDLLVCLFIYLEKYQGRPRKLFPF